MTVVALAGRRIDAAGACPPRFPLECAPTVRQRIAASLVRERASVLVCSAACGASLIALEEAERLGLRRRIVLPFAPERFRLTSVEDRPGDWGAIFDRQIAAAAATGDLVVLDASIGREEEAYAAGVEALLHEAKALARPDGACTPAQRLMAVVVWEGSARSGTDATEGFRNLATGMEFDTLSISTLC